MADRKIKLFEEEDPEIHGRAHNHFTVIILHLIRHQRNTVAHPGIDRRKVQTVRGIFTGKMPQLVTDNRTGFFPVEQRGIKQREVQRFPFNQLIFIQINAVGCHIEAFRHARNNMIRRCCADFCSNLIHPLPQPRRFLTADSMPGHIRRLTAEHSETLAQLKQALDDIPDDQHNTDQNKDHDFRTTASHHEITGKPQSFISHHTNNTQTDQCHLSGQNKRQQFTAAGKDFQQSIAGAAGSPAAADAEINCPGAKQQG